MMGVAEASPCLAIGHREFDAWLATAAPGDEIVYATGVALDLGRRATLEARRQAEAGRVDLKQYRCDAGGFRYVAQRRSEPTPPVTIVDHLLGPSPLAKVYEQLAQAAAAGQPCPTNRQIARAVGLRRREQVSHLVRMLSQRRAIMVENRGPRLTRVVTIVATGERTSVEPVPVVRADRGWAVGAVHG